MFGIDETIERRRGDKISAKGIYRDGVRSSKGHYVKASGLCWMCLMWLTPIPWAQRVWALPFLTALAPSVRFVHFRIKGIAPEFTSATTRTVDGDIAPANTAKGHLQNSAKRWESLPTIIVRDENRCWLRF